MAKFFAVCEAYENLDTNNLNWEHNIIITLGLNELRSCCLSQFVLLIVFSVVILGMIWFDVVLERTE